MKSYLVALNELPPDGKEFDLTDQEIWTEPIQEFKMDCRIVKPMQAKIFVQPADEGLLVRGEITGEVAVPCNRCAEDAIAKIDSSFSEYEDIPEESRGRQQDGCIVYQMHVPMLNLAEVCWEQFMLAMPVRPLCSDDCKGICPTCGQNLNTGQCGCSQTAGDPRLAALRNVKVKKS